MTLQHLADLKQKALQAFQRDLPQLYTQRPGQWVAYQGERQIGFAAQKYQLYQECFQRGLQREEFVIFCIEPLPVSPPDPYRIVLHRGLPFMEVLTIPDPQFQRPLLGIRALRSAGLRVEIDFAHDTVSVWTPDPAIP
jgi:hypothetical protein